MKDEGPRDGETPEAYRKRFLEEHGDEEITGLIASKRGDVENMREWIIKDVAPTYLMAKMDTKTLADSLSRFASVASALEMFAQMLEAFGSKDTMEGLHESVEQRDGDSSRDG